MVKNKCDVIDFSKVGKYKGEKWLDLEEKGKECRGRVKKFKAAVGDFTEVKRKRLFVHNRPVCKRGRVHKFEFSDARGGFVGTDTFHNAMKKLLKPYKLPLCKK